jgi:YVTN family beta-propeller protein
MVLARPFRRAAEDRRSLRARGSRVQVGDGPGGPPTGGFGSVWTTASDGSVWRVDARTGRVRAIVRVGGLPFGLAVGAGAVWVANQDDGSISRIDPATDEVVTKIPTGFHPEWLAADDRFVWVGLSSTRWSFQD